MVFARLGGAHGFTRESRVDVASLQAATRDLVREREALLRERERLVAARKVEKRAGRRGSSSPALPALEGRQRALTALQPDVGCWGWEALRKGRLGPALALNLTAAPPAFGCSGLPVFVDLRARAMPVGLADALTAALQTGSAYRLSLLLAPAELGAWRSWAEEPGNAPALEALGRTSWGARAVLVLSPLALTAAQHDDLLGLAQALQPHGWRLHFATQQNG